ncbi:hypothetical protein [Kordiimonas sp.]|uniref:hypothetical protein n=1 Tax=Kordiimonas sp. TaxID=1970157 RepID=UPI003A9246FE
MRFRQLVVLAPLCFFLVSEGTYAAFPVPQACKGATIDIERYERDAIYPPACTKNKKCGNKDAIQIADWFDAVSEQMASTLRVIPNYYAGETQNTLCTGVFAIYTRIGAFTEVEFEELTPAREQLISEAIAYAAQTAEREVARHSMSRNDLNKAKRKDREIVNARREARAAANARVQEEDRLKAAKAAERAKAEHDAAIAAFQNKVVAALLQDTDQGFILDEGTMRSNHEVLPETTFNDLMMWAVSHWHAKRSNDANEDGFKPPSKGEFETTAQYEERVATAKAAHERDAAARAREAEQMRLADLDDSVAAATGAFKADTIRYDADNQRFMVEIKTGNGVYVGEGYIAVPLDIAREVKSRLERATLIAGFMATGDTLSLKRFVLVNQDIESPTKSEIHQIEMEPLQFDMSPTRAAAWRQAYEAAKQERKRQAEAADLAERKRIAELYPYQARFSCNLGQIYICLGRDGGISVRSGSESNHYTAHDLTGRSTLEVFLMKDFEIAAQTGSGNGRKMSLEIRDYVSGKTLYSETTAGPNAVIRVTD